MRSTKSKKQQKLMAVSFGMLALGLLLAAEAPRAERGVGATGREATVGGASRQGRVRLDGRVLRDDGGPFNALGATLFWALWGEAHEPDRLDDTLRWLADRGVDYVRILGMVGAESWSDRRIDPASPDYWPAADRLLGRLARHGLRVQLTLFADAQLMMPSGADRARFVDLWAAKANEQPERFILLEIANEHWQNGMADIAELRALGRRLADKTDVLVALSAPLADQACALYAKSAADLATVHYSRDSSADDRWRPVGQPWRWPADYDTGCRGELPPAVNNEPIGPESSVYDDDDPGRLVMAYATTFVSQNAAYVLHTGAGIRAGGAGDRLVGRSANVWEVPKLHTALRGIAAAKAYLPPDLANWRRHDVGEASHPVAELAPAIEAGALRGAYAASAGGRFVAVVVGVGRPLDVRTTRTCTVDIRVPLSGEPIARRSVNRGEAFTLSGSEAFVLIGVCRD